MGNETIQVPQEQFGFTLYDADYDSFRGFQAVYRYRTGDIWLAINHGCLLVYDTAEKPTTEIQINAKSLVKLLKSNGATNIPQKCFNGEINTQQGGSKEAYLWAGLE